MKKRRYTPPPFGYLWDKDSQSFIINKKEKDCLLFIFKLLDKGQTQKEIIRLLNEQPEKYPTRKGKRWSQTTLGFMLTTKRLQFYSGFDEDNKPGTWNAIITPEHAAKLIEQLGTEEPTSRPRKNVFLVSNLDIAFCGHCDSTAKASFVKRKETKTTDYYYNCSNKEQHGLTACPNSKLVRQHLVNDLILENVTSYRINLAKIKEYTKAKEEAIVIRSNQIINKLKIDSDKTLEAIHSSTSFNPEYVEKLKSITTEVDNQLKIKTEKFDFSKFKFGRFENMDIHKQREVLKNLIRSVHIFKDHIIINYYFAVTPSGNTQVSLNYEKK
ncbi:MAG: recombinase family protein [Ignavibacteriaceae bacterium]|jgi:hypothetical protein|nr:recombinase family protein [Ignavibacteriaceae bacterium]